MFYHVMHRYDKTAQYELLFFSQSHLRIKTKFPQSLNNKFLSYLFVVIHHNLMIMRALISKLTITNFRVIKIKNASTNLRVKFIKHATKN